MARIASSPVLSYWIVTEQTWLAIVGCCLAAGSDALDGYLARHHNMSTTLGTYLDPLADKILINVLSVSLWANGTLPTPLMALWLCKDIVLMTATYRHVQDNTEAGRAVMDPTTTPLQVNPTTISKINTALQFATLALGIAHPVLWDAATATAAQATTEGGLQQLILPILAGPALPALCWVTGATTVASVGSYIGHSAFSEVMAPAADPPDDNSNQKKMK